MVPVRPTIARIQGPAQSISTINQHHIVDGTISKRTVQSAGARYNHPGSDLEPHYSNMHARCISHADLELNLFLENSARSSGQAAVPFLDRNHHTGSPTQPLVCVQLTRVWFMRFSFNQHQPGTISQHPAQPISAINRHGQLNAMRSLSLQQPAHAAYRARPSLCTDAMWTEVAFMQRSSLRRSTRCCLFLDAVLDSQAQPHSFIFSGASRTYAG